MLPRWVHGVAQFRWWLISGATLAYLPVGYSTSGGDYDFFRNGARVLLGLPTSGVVGSRGHFGMYAADPSTQVGPVALLVTTPLAWLGRDSGRLVLSVVMALALTLLLWLTERAGRILTTRSEPDLQLVVLLAGLMSIPMWHQVVLYAHLDDVLVMVGAAMAIDCLARGRALALGAVIGLAVDAKPWALGLLPLVAALPTARRRAVAASAAVAVVAVGWAPFLLVRGTLSGLAGYHIPVAAQSPLTLLSIEPHGPMPAWARPAQLGIGLLLAGLAVARRRPAAVPLVVVAVRVALDAGAYSYYYTGLVIGCAILEIAGTNRRIPVLTGLVAFIEFDVTWLLNSNSALAGLNAAAATLAIAGLLIRPPTPVEAPNAVTPTRWFPGACW